MNETETVHILNFRISKKKSKNKCDRIQLESDLLPSLIFNQNELKCVFVCVFFFGSAYL